MRSGEGLSFSVPFYISREDSYQRLLLMYVLQTSDNRVFTQVFVLLHQLQIFSLGRPLPEQPPIHSPADRSGTSRATIAGLNVSVPKPGTELKLG